MDDERRTRLQQRAYALWEQQGRPQGRHEDHWRQAESEAGDDEAPTSHEGTTSSSDAATVQAGAPGTGGLVGKGAPMGDAAAGDDAALDALAGGGGRQSETRQPSPASVRATRGGPQQGAVDPAGPETGSREDLE